LLKPITNMPQVERQRTIWHLLAMLLLVLGNAWLQCAQGDLIEENNGLGSDGWWYCQFARELPKWLNSSDPAHQIPYERLQRILPSAAVWAAFQALDITEPSDAQIVKAFRWLNALSLAVSVLLWQLVGNRLDLQWPGRWFGFLAIFASCGFAKWLWYYPVLTDVATLPLAMLLLLAFLRRSLVFMAIVTIPGSFVCSTLSFWSMPLFLCLTAVRPRPAGAAEQWKVNLITAVCVMIGVAAIIQIQFFTEFPRVTYKLKTQMQLLPLSILAAAAYLWFAGRPLVAWKPFVRPRLLARAFFTPGMAVWIGVTLSIKAISEMIMPGSSSQSTQSTLGLVFGDQFSIFGRGTVLPLWFMVAHVLYFGPVVLVCVLRWKELCRRFGEQGLAMLLFTGMIVVLGLDSESRHLYVGLPFLVAFAAKEIEELRPRRIFWWSFAALTLAFSASWLAIRHLWCVWTGQSPQLDDEYYSHFCGPFSVYDVYGEHAAYALLALGLLYLCLRPSPDSSAAERKPEPGC